ncbi:hypothetical protein N2152v2_000707 [Parachlorella kessleri]
MFGWNALAIMIVERGNFTSGCAEEADGSVQGICKSQESKLAVIWTVGIFALNCGPVIMGFVLDFLGPKFTGILGVLLNMLGLVLFGVSSTDGTNAFIPAAIILGLGGITFHLAQFHISALYPRQRGLVSAVFVAGFTGCGIIMYILQSIFEDAGGTSAAYKGVLIGYSGVCAFWIPLIAWMMPNDSFKVGVVYLMRKDWRFETRNRSELGALSYRRTTSLQDFVAASAATRERQNGIGLHLHSRRGPEFVGRQPEHAAVELVSGAMPDSSHPMWSQQEEEPPGAAAVGSPAQHRQQPEQQQQQHHHLHTNGGSKAAANGVSPVAGPSPPDSRTSPSREPVSPSAATLPPPGVPAVEGAEIGPESVPLPSDVVWGPLVFEARRFVELRKKSFKEQFLSSESFGMGVFYTLNVFFMQFYLGTMRLQLEDKGDNDHTLTNFGNIVVAFAFVTIPVIGWLLDKKGYGWTLGTINALAVLASAFQATPPLGLQVVSILLWMVARFFMYSSYFAIFGALFGFRNFGRLVAIDNTFNGLFGLLQYPLTYLGIHGLDGNFTAINVAQVIVLLPLFVFCWYMYKWEREDLVPIRPMEGEELPVDMMGPRIRRKRIQLHWPHLPGFHNPQQSHGSEVHHHAPTATSTTDVEFQPHSPASDVALPAAFQPQSSSLQPQRH